MELIRRAADWLVIGGFAACSGKFGGVSNGHHRLGRDRVMGMASHVGYIPAVAGRPDGGPTTRAGARTASTSR